MAFKRKRTFRKPTMRKRRRFNIVRRKRTAQRSGFCKVVRWSAQDTTNFCHLQITGNDTIFSGSSGTTFSMSNVNGVGELVSLFDNFRILKVYYRWVCTRNPDYATGVNNKGIYPRINWCHDFNSSGGISTNLMYQRSNMREFYFTDSAQKTKWYSLRPAMLANMYESAVATAYQPQWGKWIDTSDNATAHYGILYNWDQCFTGLNVRLEAKVLMECKGIS